MADPRQSLIDALTQATAAALPQLTEIFTKQHAIQIPQQALSAVQRQATGAMDFTFPYGVVAVPELQKTDRFAITGRQSLTPVGIYVVDNVDPIDPDFTALSAMANTLADYLWLNGFGYGQFIPRQVDVRFNEDAEPNATFFVQRAPVRAAWIEGTVGIQRWGI